MVVATSSGSSTSLATDERLYDESELHDELTEHVQRILLRGGAAWGALLLRDADPPASLACAVDLPHDIASTLDSGEIVALLERAHEWAEQQIGWVTLALSTVRHAYRTYALPFWVEHSVPGLLIVAYPRDAPEDAHQLPLLEVFADSLGLRIHGARLKQRIARLTSQLAMINRLGQHTTSIHDRRQLLEQMTRLIYETLGHDHILLLLSNEANNTVELVHASGAAGEQLLGEGFREQIGGKGIIGWVARSGQIWISNDVTRDPHYHSHTLLPHTAAEVALPLRMGERIIGVLDVQSERRHAFDDDDVFLLQIVADQIASALEHSRLFRAEHRERELATTLSDVSRIICSSLDLDQVLDLILQQIDRVVPHIGTRITLLDEGTAMRVVAAKGYPDNEEAKRASFTIEQAPLAPLIMYEGQTVVVRDARRDPRWIWLPGASQVRSWCGTPLVIKDRSIGFLCVDWGEPDFYTETHARIVRAFADQAAVAIENARLYAVIKSFNEQLEHSVQQRTAELRHAWDEIAAKAEQLRALVRRVVMVQETERQRIANDLHDSVTQAILAAIYELHALRRRIGGHNPEADRQLDECQQLLDGTLLEMKQIIYALRPRALDELGFLAALEHFAAAVQTHHGLNVTFQAFGTAYHLPAEAELAIYRIVQEATQNSIRHANANHVTISVEFRPWRIRVAVCDDGCGFDPGVVNDGLGLVGMRERAQALGGQFSVVSRVEEGTEVSLEFQRPDRDR